MCDDDLTLESDILYVINSQIAVTSGHISLTESDYIKVERLLYNKLQQLGCLFESLYRLKSSPTIIFLSYFFFKLVLILVLM